MDIPKDFATEFCNDTLVVCILWYKNFRMKVAVIIRKEVLMKKKKRYLTFTVRSGEYYISSPASPLTDFRKALALARNEEKRMINRGMLAQKPSKEKVA